MGERAPDGKTLWISVDLEGVAGLIVERQMGLEGGAEFARAQRFMTDEANAAVRGGLAAGAARALVNDAHGAGRNLIPEALDARAELLQGALKPLVMAEGVDAEGVCAGVLIGYHGRAGVQAVLSHTWIDLVVDLRLNGASTGEIGLVAAVAGEHGVPIAVLTGDDVACREAAELLPGVRTVQTKRALNRGAAQLRHPAEVCEEIEATVREALAAGAARPHRLELPATVEVDWPTATLAEACTMLHGIERAGVRTVAFEAATATQALQTFDALTRLVESVEG